MIWSLSSAKSFRRCQRQWFFQNCLANHRAKHGTAARNAYVLSKLCSVWAWRGKLVDTVVSKHIVPLILRKREVNLRYIISIAHDLYDRQLAFAEKSSCWDPGLVVSRVGDEFAALMEIEYDGEVTNDALTQAWSDIKLALTNLLNTKELLSLLYDADYLVAQRALQYTHDEFPCGPVKVKSFPDLVAFFADRPPLIVDWKVHTFGTADYRRQLSTYALTLTRCNPHRDFPPGVSCSPTDIDLIEAQLLRKRLHTYKLDSADLVDIEAYVEESITLMRLAIDGRTKEQLEPEVFPTTIYPTTCQSCAFRALCWEEKEQ